MTGPTTGALTTPHPLATAVGMDVLRQGGTAPEALVAAGAALSVVMPHFNGLGGDAVWLVAPHQGVARCYLGIGQGIARPTPQGAIPMRGPGSVLTTAAVVSSWDHAVRRARDDLGGRMRWGDLLAPAIALAEDGFAVSPSQAFWGEYRAADLSDWPGFAPIFTVNGAPLRAGALLRQPELAASLREIADHGAGAFYQGALSRRILDGLRAAGVLIGAEDLVQTRTRETAPLSLPYRGLILLAPPPPTQGVTTLQIMGQLARLDLAALQPGGVDHLHLCVEAVKRAFLDRVALADPGSMASPVEGWLHPDHLDAMARRIDPDRALPWPQPWQHGDTVFLGAIDAQGNAASLLQSTYFDWGSGVVAGDTGILWQNRGAAFSTDPLHPNGFAPGKLPFYTLNPGLALKDGKPHLAYGTQGADGQPQTLAMILSRLFDFGQSLTDALAGPRFLLGRTFSDGRDSLKIEADAGEATLAALAARGHEVCPIAAQSPLAGQAGLVLADACGARALHDPRGRIS